MIWKADGGGFVLRTETTFGRVWPQTKDAKGPWYAVVRPEPFIEKSSGWEGPREFEAKKAACEWVEQRADQRRAAELLREEARRVFDPEAAREAVAHAESLLADKPHD